MLLLSINPILMHSLSLLLLLLPLPTILNIQYRMLVYHQWPCLSAMLYYQAVITWEVITGLYLYT